MAGIVNMFAASPYLGVLRFGGRTPTNPRDCDLQPKVARNYLGSQFGNKFNRNAVVAKSRAATKTELPQPRCGWECLLDDNPA